MLNVFPFEFKSRVPDVILPSVTRDVESLPAYFHLTSLYVSTLRLILYSPFALMVRLPTHWSYTSPVDGS